MSDGTEETKVNQGLAGLRRLAERIDLHIKDLGTVQEEVRKVGQLISETMQPERQERGLDNLSEAADRLERRVEKWIEEIVRGFAAIKNEVSSNGTSGDKEDTYLGAGRNCTIFLLDDRLLFRNGLTKILEGKAGFRVVGEAASLEEALPELEKAMPDLAVVHVCPEEPGQSALSTVIRKSYPALKVLVLTERGDSDFFVGLIRSGADGYLIDDCSEQTLFRAIGRVLEGESYLSPRISEALLAGWRKGKEEEEKPLLTRREEEVLRLVAAGKSSKVIGQELFISAHTVDRHRANIMAKLNIRKAVDLVKYAISRGLVPSDRKVRRDD